MGKHLDAGRKIVVRHTSEKPDGGALLSFFDSARRKREAYSEYLFQMKDGFEELLRVREAHKNEVKEAHALLSQVAKITQSSELPLAILAKAEEKSIRLTLLRVKRIKFKMRKDRPTP